MYVCIYLFSVVSNQNTNVDSSIILLYDKILELNIVHLDLVSVSINC